MEKSNPKAIQAAVIPVLNSRPKIKVRNTLKHHMPTKLVSITYIMSPAPLNALETTVTIDTKGCEKLNIRIAVVPIVIIPGSFVYILIKLPANINRILEITTVISRQILMVFQPAFLQDLSVSPPDFDRQ